MELLLEYLKPIVEMMAGKFPPAVIMIFTVMGALRMAMKPIMSMIQIYVDATPSKEDDGLVEKIKGHKAYKMIAYILDWLASVKLPKKEEKK